MCESESESERERERPARRIKASFLTSDDAGSSVLKQV